MNLHRLVRLSSTSNVLSFFDSLSCTLFSHQSKQLAADLAAVYASSGDSMTINSQIGIVISVETSQRDLRLSRFVLVLADRLSVTIRINWLEYEVCSPVFPASGLVWQLDECARSVEVM
jgi:hypothetical protein